MPKSKYAIPINEDTLDLLEFINNDVRPEIEEKPTYFFFDTDTSSEIATTIKFEDDLYDAHGYLKDPDLKILQ